MWLANRALHGAGRSGLVGWLAVLGVLAWFQGGPLLRNWKRVVQPNIVNGDALQQIFPFFKYVDSSASAFAHDYVADYYLANYPLGYFGLYAGAAKIGIDPTVVSRYLPHLLYVVAAVFVGAAANRLGGKLAALAAMALVFGSNIYLYRMSGGVPRMFAFPILAALLLGLVSARVWWCAACVVAGALFYPVAAVISGFALAGMVLFGKVVGSPVSSWSWLRRFAFLSGTAFLAVALLLPSAVSSSRYGRLLRPSDVREFPEIGAGGRYDSDSRPPFRGYFASLPKAVNETLNGATTWSETAHGWLIHGRRQTEAYRTLMDGLLGLVLLGGTGLLVRRKAARRVLLLGVASVVGHTLARFAAPYAYLPERYVAYPVPLLFALLLACCATGLFPPAFDAGWLRSVRAMLFGLYVAALLFLLGGQVSKRTGGSLDLSAREELFDAIGALPADALVAGWPRGAINQVPYAARRRALMTVETHQVFHEGYTLEMRRRMDAIINAYFATSLEPIVRLRDEFGVTHLLVEREHFDERPPGYFVPFDRWIRRRQAAARRQEYELPKHIGTAGVFSHGGTVLLDLSRIESVPKPTAEP